ncbi:hypothetical protein NECAME_09791 [Necator americanus]|uniref:Uncharacterized protein n=1 Tax=Necator americanus TaxID=51031 RepID=W2TBN4_NECAM|nr:hypothetical protein NECAME_09791 [Necator americanus]ETN79455.1 hypothetical protein NECAME_09791 [Necator americanus]
MGGPPSEEGNAPAFAKSETEILGHGLKRRRNRNYQIGISMEDISWLDVPSIFMEKITGGPQTTSTVCSDDIKKIKKDLKS